MEWDCENWEAWRDRMPGKPVTVHVSGTCTFPTRGYVAAIKRHEPQGINDKDLLLELEITEPTGAEPEVPTPITVTYEEQTDHPYTTATVIGGGPDASSLAIRDVS